MMDQAADGVRLVAGTDVNWVLLNEELTRLLGSDKLRQLRGLLCEATDALHNGI